MTQKKSIKFKEQQDEIIEKIVEFLNLDEKGCFILHYVDNNEDIQNNIMGLVPEIKKYFLINNIQGLTYPDKCERPWLSIVRGLLRKKYYILATDYVVKLENGKNLHSRKYHVLEK